MIFTKSLYCILICTTLFQSLEIQSQHKVSQDVNHISSVELIELPPLDNTALKKVNHKNSPNTFGEAREINVSPLLNGTWESTKSGTSVWRQRIKSPNAYSLNLGFTEFRLEKGVSLYIYNKSKSEIFGPFTEKDNDDHLQLWTPMVSGDEIVIEVQGAPDAIAKSQLLISSINHDFVDVKAKMLSGSCNIDVACGEADGFGIVDNYRDIISSVGAYTLNGVNQCSGMLINNTAMDCKPYFITANHCNISESNASSVVVYWNYENQTCRQPNSIESGFPGNGMREQFNSGSVLRANSVNSDFTLIELDDPIDQTLNLYFSGWDLSGELTDTSICIHHPNVEEKRISFDFDPMIYETGDDQTDYIRVLDWDLGTTEPGSSGAPIFNSRKQFIGQLNGGFAACGNEEYDVFGYINYSWNRNSSAARSLKSWLDPISSEQKSLQGIYCGLNLELSANQIDLCVAESDEVVIDILPSVFFEMVIDYSVIEVPEGITVNFEKESSTGIEGNSLTISGFENVEDGDYTIIIAANDGLNIIEAEIVLNLFSNIPNAAKLKEPDNNSEDISTKVTLAIFRNGAPNNVFQVALDSEFNNIIYENTTSFFISSLDKLTSSTEYFWRARSFNSCGTTEWSDVYSFKTEDSFCTTITSADGPYEIDENFENTVSSEILINYPVRVQDVNVQNINGIHTYLEDLAFSLSFNGNDVLLTEEICGDLDDFNFGFDDESANSQISCPPIEGDLFIPIQSLESYEDMLAGGLWMLNVQDKVTSDGGVFNEWSIRICFNEAEAPVIIPEFSKYDYCENQVLTINAYYNTQNLTDNFDLIVVDESGQNIEKEIFINPNRENRLSFEIETQLLSSASHQVQVALQNKSNLEIIALSFLTLEQTGDEKILNITSPIEEEIIPLDGFNAVAWNDDFEGVTTVEISEDEQFGEVVYSQTVSNLNVLDVSSISLLPGIYFVRIKNQYECGEVSSEAVSFVIDESNSIDYTPLLSIDIYPNPTNGLIYIKNENEFEYKTAIQLYDITGRYYKPKLHYVSNNLVVLDLNDKDDGLYIIKIEKDNKVIQELVLKSQ